MSKITKQNEIISFVHIFLNVFMDLRSVFHVIKIYSTTIVFIEAKVTYLLKRKLKIFQNIINRTTKIGDVHSRLVS